MKLLHPDLTEGEKEDLLAAGIDLFNRGQFFAAHEPWEEVWRSTNPEPRALFQGLVQVAAGFHHWQTAGRRGSALRLFERGRGHLAPLPPNCCGLDLTGFLGEMGRWQNWLTSPSGEPPPYPSLQRSQTRGSLPER